MRELAIAFVLGVAFSAVPGIVTAESIRRGLAGGFWPATIVGIGSLLGDAFYAVLALSGLLALRNYSRARLWIEAAGGLLLVWLALDALRARVPGPGESPVRSARHNDLLVGAGLSLTNPWALAFWVGFGGVLLSAGIRNPEANLWGLLGAFLAGALAWSLVLSLLIAFARRFVGARLFRIVSVGSALIFLGTGAYTFWQVYRDAIRVP